jgi:hypothetical protein
MKPAANVTIATQLSGASLESLSDGLHGVHQEDFSYAEVCIGRLRLEAIGMTDQTKVFGDDLGIDSFEKFPGDFVDRQPAVDLGLGLCRLLIIDTASKLSEQSFCCEPLESVCADR